VLTRDRVISSNAKASIAEVLSRHKFGKNLVIVCDDNTWLVAGQAIHQQLANDYHITTHSLGRTPHATIAHTEALRTMASHADGLIAVGSGTINDITKYASTQLEKPYISIATASSMNGYTSATASLEANGFKRSYPAKPPVAVIVDIDILTAAPKRLARAGFGDTLCRSTVEADMLLSHLLLGSPYPKEIFNTLRKHESNLIALATKLRDQEPAVITALMEALLDTGDAMATFGSSAIASQGEHMIAHTVEMIYSSEVMHITHGEIIAVTTLTSGYLQQKMMLSHPKIKTVIRQESTFLRLFGQKRAPALMEAYRGKVLSTDQVNDISTKLETGWADIKQQLNAIILLPKTVERAFMVATVPTKPSDIKLDDERYKTAANNAHMTRERFTFLDLAAMNDKMVV
jgi:glycerol-1-phosphate dehydrogenase [NAD(P)+]